MGSGHVAAAGSPPARAAAARTAARLFQTAELKPRFLGPVVNPIIQALGEAALVVVYVGSMRACPHGWCCLLRRPLPGHGLDVGRVLMLAD